MQHQRQLLHASARRRDHTYATRRAIVIPEDVRGLAVPVLAHRIVASGAVNDSGRAAAERVLNELLERIPVPA